MRGTGVRGLYGLRTSSNDSGSSSGSVSRGSLSGLHTSSGPPISLIVRGGTAAGMGSSSNEPQRPQSAPSLRSGSSPYLGGSGSGFALLQSTSSAVPLYGDGGGDGGGGNSNVEQRLRIVKRNRASSSSSSRDLQSGGVIGTSMGHGTGAGVFGRGDHHHHHHSFLSSGATGSNVNFSGIVREPSREKPIQPIVQHAMSRCEMGGKIRTDDPIHSLVSDAFDALLFAPEDDDVSPPTLPAGTTMTPGRTGGSSNSSSSDVAPPPPPVSFGGGSRSGSADSHHSSASAASSHLPHVSGTGSTTTGLLGNSGSTIGGRQPLGRSYLQR